MNWTASTQIKAFHWNVHRMKLWLQYINVNDLFQIKYIKLMSNNLISIKNVLKNEIHFINE